MAGTTPEWRQNMRDASTQQHNRYLKVRRFMEKRCTRIWDTRKVDKVRKDVAKNRTRIGGRFVGK